jgi:DNA-binding Lrp family transcriptional regulator
MNETQIRIIKALQDGLPLSEEPFLEVARKAGVSQEDLLTQLRVWKEDGTIRRFGAMLRHRQAGYTANAMGVWNVPDARIEAFGQAAAGFRAVSHCYRRPRFEGFRYNLYTMIHGRSKEECEEVARRISAETGITDYRLLYTTAEFKKSSPAYFAEDA